MATPAETETRPLLDTLTAIRTRRSIKQYSPAPIPKEWVMELLDAAHWAPNHYLTHPWRFRVFTGEGRERLVDARYQASVFGFQQKGETVPDNAYDLARTKCYSAPVIIIVSMITNEDPTIDRENYGSPSRICCSPVRRAASGPTPALATGLTTTLSDRAAGWARTSAQSPACSSAIPTRKRRESAYR